MHRSAVVRVDFSRSTEYPGPVVSCRSSLLLRRSLLASAGASLLGACSVNAGRSPTQEPRPLTGGLDRLRQLEAASGGRLGVAALDTGNKQGLLLREEERFPLCSTFKVVLVAQILKRSETEPALLQQRLRFAKQDLVPYSPVTEHHLDDGMSIPELCAAALQYSDNTAGNLLLDRLGGPAEVTAFARSLGDEMFRLDRREVELNTAIPGDPRDTTTPASMMHLLRRLLLEDALLPAGREQMISWMLGNTTGNSRIRAGVPAGWRVAEKTGTGAYGVTNDVGVLWPTGRAPVLLVLFFSQNTPKAEPQNATLAQAARIVAETLAPG